MSEIPEGRESCGHCDDGLDTVTRTSCRRCGGIGGVPVRILQRLTPRAPSPVTDAMVERAARHMMDRVDSRSDALLKAYRNEARGILLAALSTTQPTTQERHGE